MILLKNYPLLAKEYESAFARSGKKMILGKMYDTMQLPQPASADTLASDEYSEYFRFNSDSAAVFKGQVFILIGNRTYSSAGMFVTVAYDNHIAEVVGNASTFLPIYVLNSFSPESIHNRASLRIFVIYLSI